MLDKLSGTSVLDIRIFFDGLHTKVSATALTVVQKLDARLVLDERE